MGAVTPLAGILPVLTGIGSAVSFIDKQTGLFNRITGRDDKTELKQLNERNRLQQQQLAQNIALQKEQGALDAAQKDSERREALRRAVARQRAKFGAQGVGSNGGSSEAVLLGLFDESDEERKKREDVDALRTRALDNNLSQAAAGNLLEATQLAERQKVQRVYLA